MEADEMIALIHNWNVKEDTIQSKTQEEKMDSPLKPHLNQTMELKIMLVNVKLNNKKFYVKNQI